MKQILLPILILLSSCSTMSELNQKIVGEHRSSLKNSPFNSAKTAKRYVKVQRKVRESYLRVIDSVLSSNPQDTVYLIETHSHICINCPADLVQLWTHENYIELNRFDSTYGSYSISTLRLQDIDHYFTSPIYQDIRKLKEEMNKGIDWWKKPTKYGTEQCSDGSHSFYTVFFNDRIESMYMRCYRYKKKNNPQQ
jgi:hypothetical protein